MALRNVLEMLSSPFLEEKQKCTEELSATVRNLLRWRDPPQKTLASSKNRIFLFSVEQHRHVLEILFQLLFAKRVDRKPMEPSLDGFLVSEKRVLIWLLDTLERSLCETIIPLQSNSNSVQKSLSSVETDYWQGHEKLLSCLREAKWKAPIVDVIYERKSSSVWDSIDNQRSQPSLICRMLSSCSTLLSVALKTGKFDLFREISEHYEVPCEDTMQYPALGIGKAYEAAKRLREVVKHLESPFTAWQSLQYEELEMAVSKLPVTSAATMDGFYLASEMSRRGTWSSCKEDLSSEEFTGARAGPKKTKSLNFD